METERIGQVLSAREIFDLVREDLEGVEKVIDADRSPRLKPLQPSDVTCSRAAASVCARHCCCCARAFSGGAGSTAVQLGAVVEMIHAATLVHDDVIDVAQTRRGRPSANVQWGNHTCVLAGGLALHAGLSGGAARTQLPHPGPADQPDPDGWWKAS